jgi:hypothetical protein
VVFFFFLYDNFIALKLQKKFTIYIYIYICRVMITPGSDVVVKFTLLFFIIFIFNKEEVGLLGNMEQSCKFGM